MDAGPRAWRCGRSDLEELLLSRNNAQTPGPSVPCFLTSYGRPSTPASGMRHQPETGERLRRPRFSRLPSWSNKATPAPPISRRAVGRESVAHPAGRQRLGPGFPEFASLLPGYSCYQIPKPETRNSKPETRNSKPETRNPKLETRNPKPETQNPFLSSRPGAR